jgi:N utilization substance protein A
MTRRKLDSDLIKVLSMFQAVTRAQPRDVVETEERMIFIIEPNQIRKAIGKNGENVRRLEKSLNRKIKIVEFNSEVTKFVRNLIYPAKTTDVAQDGETITITPADSMSRGRIIGRGAQTLREYERIARRYFEVKEIKVI